jgi:hypothetical protein
VELRGQGMQVKLASLSFAGDCLLMELAGALG